MFNLILALSHKIIGNGRFLSKKKKKIRKVFQKLKAHSMLFFFILQFDYTYGFKIGICICQYSM